MTTTESALRNMLNELDELMRQIRYVTSQAERLTTECENLSAILKVVRTPDRFVNHQGICDGMAEFDGFQYPCPFNGVVSVALFDDTEEAIWHCPTGHENYESWVRFS